MNSPKPFLTAEWRSLILLNYEIDPELLQSHLPFGTELDEWQGRHFVSLVGFLFLDTRLLGWPIPFHRNFEEVNLRFYVRREGPDGWRRGVVFIRELVPRHAVAWTANLLYNENYRTLPMSHSHQVLSQGEETERTFKYSWKHQGRNEHLEAKVSGDPQELVDGSEEEFIAEHYWGYSRRSLTQTNEYRVDHPPWRVWKAIDPDLSCDTVALYGPEFGGCLNSPPTSALVAEGSEIKVFPWGTVS